MADVDVDLFANNPKGNMRLRFIDFYGRQRIIL
jgi:hypothetical protein